MRILVLGDSHCDAEHIDFAYDKAERFNCDAIFVVGDFGWWTNFKDGHEFLRFCSLRARRTEIPLYWLDGNHEYHPDLVAMVEDEGHDGFIELDQHFYYSPRGNTWVWDDVRFMTLGGAFSIDRANRILGIDWFEEEMISEDDVDYCIDQGEVDVLLCHDAPAEVDMNAEFATKGRRMYKDHIEGTFRNRERLQRVVNACNPNVVVHGHWHHQYTYISDLVENRRVFGLDCNMAAGRSWTVLDTQDIKERR